MTLSTEFRTASLVLPDSILRLDPTPIVPLIRVTSHLPSGLRILAKAEWFHPSGSVKDRPAAWILRRALESGSLEGSRALLDSTSGNMGIAYATFAARLGLRVHLVIPANAGAERLAVLRALGAGLTLSDPSEGSDGARELAAEMARLHPERYFYADQYSHPANWQAHFETTGPEIVAQTTGQLTHFVAGLGTTGTLTGVGRFLRLESPSTRIIGVQPATPLHGLEGLKHLATSPVPPIFDPSLLDDTIEVETEEAYAMGRRLAREEGLFVGVSAAAAAAAALRLAATMDHATIVVLFPDSGLKYLGLPFWKGSG